MSYYRATLSSAITAAQTSGIILSEQLQAISGTVYLNILDPLNVETISCTGQGVTGELTGVTRAVATYSGETATAYAHGAGVTIVLSDDWNYWQDMATGLNDKVNIGGDTMTGLLQFSGATNPGIKMNNLTTVQRDALTPANGEVIYNTTTGELNVYQGGAWVAIASGSTQPDGSTTVAGKYQTATVAQQTAATATGSTGSQLVPVTANMVTTSAGAGDAGKIVVLGATGVIAPAALDATATPTASKIVISDSTGKIADGWVGATTAGDTIYSDGTDLQRLAIGTSDQIMKSTGTAPSWSSNYSKKIDVTQSTLSFTNNNTEQTIYSATIPGGSLSTNNLVKMRVYMTVIGGNGSSQSVTFKLKYGATTIATHVTSAQTLSSSKSFQGFIEGIVMGDSSTSSQKGILFIDLLGQQFFPSGTVSVPVLRAVTSGTASETSTADKTLSLTIQIPDATNQFTSISGWIELVR